MEKYILKYQKSDGVKHFVHPSWYELCEKQTKEDVIKIIKKHLYEPGEYDLHFYVRSGRMLCKTNQNFFSGWLTRKNEEIAKGIVPIGYVEFDYSDDKIDTYDFKNIWPEIDCENELANPEAKFTVVGARMLPSPKEYESISKRSAEKFTERLYKSVSFPLEIACDYPDVIFEFCYDFEPDQNLTADTLRLVEEYAAKYNRRHSCGIHYVADVTNNSKGEKTNAVCIHVDFGNCEANALALMIKSIGKSSLPIKKLILK